MLDFYCFFPSRRGDWDWFIKQKTEENYDKCMMSQVLSETDLAFSAEEDTMLLDKANKFVLSFFW